MATSALALAIAAITVAGCGDSAATTTSAPERQAAADSPTTCPEIRGSSTEKFTFINKTSDLITLRTEPGWTCGNSSVGFSGVSTPASLNGVQVPAGGSVTRGLEVAGSSSRSGRFGLSFYSGSDRPQIMPIAPTGNVMRFVETGETGGITKYKGYYVQKGDDPGALTCQISFPTALADGTQATVSFNSYSVGCGKKIPEITFAPR